MSETQQKVQNTTGSIRSPEKIEDTFSRMKVSEDSMEQSNPYRPSERDCLFFLRTGQCGYGTSCRYNHPLTHIPQGVIYYKDQLPERDGEPDCEYFLKTGACKYGPTCKYHHPKDRNGAGPVQFNVLGYPMRQGEKSCPFYMQTGTCRFGVACKFHHPHIQPPNDISAYAMPSLPSLGFPYANGMTMMSLPPATYGVMPHPQIPQSQAYMPFLVAPSQGLLPPQVWANYMAASNPIYNVNTLPDLSSSATMPLDVTSHQHSVSERAQCRFFMNTGTCKYGDDCKYSHPKERFLQSPPNLLNPMLLPARPGHPACEYFKSYGFCNFGANCKFDHSMLLNPYNNTSLAMSSLPTPYSYAPPMTTTHLRISSPPNRSVSTKGKPAAENQTSEIEKQDDGLTEPEKSEVSDSLPPNHSDSPKGKSDPESQNLETEKQDNEPAKELDNSNNSSS